MAYIIRHWKAYWTLSAPARYATNVRPTGYWFTTREDLPDTYGPQERAAALAGPLREGWRFATDEHPIYRTWEGDGVDMVGWEELGDEGRALLEQTVRDGVRDGAPQGTKGTYYSFTVDSPTPYWEAFQAISGEVAAPQLVTDRED